ncbi:MAG: hypothetical protein JWL96_720 [Sphingomonas bacterium]|uniref:hypothetical protein n=1 Tax=Sphingomonas bacterium TaxID=1895847 RepID=UPI00261FA446|nr:hypothetical protein [Sphingomonas bacterium]MDB5708650.1 hypothetical protein [Sphingomonas bacterium]
MRDARCSAGGVARHRPSGGVAAPLDPAGRHFCLALDGLVREARRSGEVQNIGIFAGHPTNPDGDWEFACSEKHGVAAQAAFCAAAMDAVGFEFKHRFPWLVDACLREAHVTPIEDIADGAGFDVEKRIEHLSADWRGVHVEVRYTPEGGVRNNYWGNYDLIVSPR